MRMTKTSDTGKVTQSKKSEKLLLQDQKLSKQGDHDHLPKQEDQKLSKQKVSKTLDYELPKTSTELNKPLQEQGLTVVSDPTPDSTLPTPQNDRLPKLKDIYVRDTKGNVVPIRLALGTSRIKMYNTLAYAMSYIGAMTAEEINEYARVNADNLTMNEITAIELYKGASKPAAQRDNLALRYIVDIQKSLLARDRTTMVSVEVTDRKKRALDLLSKIENSDFASKK